jgi:dihydroorotase
LRRGSAADVTIFDPDRRWTVEAARLRSKSRNTPWAGESLPGLVRWTIVSGRVVHRADAGV